MLSTSRNVAQRDSKTLSVEESVCTATWLWIQRGVLLPQGSRNQFHRKCMPVHRNPPSVLPHEMESLFLGMFSVKFSKMCRSC